MDYLLFIYIMELECGLDYSLTRISDMEGWNLVGTGLFVGIGLLLHVEREVFQEW